MKIRKFEIIECPKCGYEYLPSEVYIPKYFFGTPTNIKRDPNGKLVYYEGSSVDVFEHYTCDNCNSDFRVVAKLQLTTETPVSSCFSEEHVTRLKNNIFIDD